MSNIELPDEIADLIKGPITDETLMQLRAYYSIEAGIDAKKSNELFEIAARVGDRGGPEFNAFLSEAMAAFLMRGFSPFRSRVQG
ncbi:MAG: hypothetical protein JJU21_14150 [Salinarimonas sp.]|nr:hypothetical protein [Salinarimonas sp.]